MFLAVFDTTLPQVGILTLIYQLLPFNFLQHWNFRPSQPLKYSDVFYGWPLIMFFRWMSLNLDAQFFAKQVLFLFSKLDSLPKVTLWRWNDNKYEFPKIYLLRFFSFLQVLLMHIIVYLFSIDIWKMFGRPDGCGMTAPFRDKGFIQCYEVNRNSNVAGMS